MATSLLVSNHAEATYDFGFSGTLLAQTVTMPSGYDRIDYIKLKLRRIGSVSGNVTVSIYRTSGGVPTGSAIQSATYTANSISTSGQVITFNMTDVSVSNGEKIAIVMSHGGTSASNTIAWYCTHSGTYSGGDSFYKPNGGSWTSNGYDMYFELWGYQSADPPTVVTDDVYSPTTSGMSVDIDVTSDGGATITERGAVYSSTNATPTTGDSKQTTTGTTGTGTFALAGLLPGVTYYVRCYATNSQGTSYGDIFAVTTLSTTPTVTSDAVTSISSTGGVGAGTVTSNGGSAVTERGVVINTSTNPTTSHTKFIAGSGNGVFTANISGLSANTLYYMRAYAINENGTVYGANISFTTLDVVKKWAQSFTTAVNGTITRVKVLAKLVAGTSGQLKVKIYSDSTGSPGTLLYTATPVAVTSGEYTYIEVPISLAVTTATVYWIVIEDPFVSGVGGYHIYIGSNSAGGYAGGAIKYTKASAPTSWINTSHTTDDMAFYVYTQPAITAPYNAEIRLRKLYK